MCFLSNGLACRINAGHTTVDKYSFYALKTSELQDLVDPKSVQKLQVSVSGIGVFVCFF